MSSVPDSLGAVIRGCQTHYSNDSIAELERSLLHREEKKKKIGREGAGWKSCAILLVFSLFSSSDVASFLFRFLLFHEKDKQAGNHIS